VVEAVALMVLTHGRSDLLSRFLFATGGSDESTTSRNEIKIAAEG
jgi:hypothetical protein